MRYPILPSSFYARDVALVARELLGMLLVSTIGKSIISGIIIETEAYGFKDDPASHAYRGLTNRNKAMFGDVGYSYVYCIYGIHYCFNLVARHTSIKAGAVLIRALKPIEGTDVMQTQRGSVVVSNLTNGPGKVAQALGITSAHNGLDCTTQQNVHVEKYNDSTLSGVEVSKRIGISKGVGTLWRFCLNTL